MRLEHPLLREKFLERAMLSSEEWRLAMHMAMHMAMMN
jgi:hypothetical protein